MPFLKSRSATGHAAGIYSDMTLDGPEIGTLVVVVDRAKNLPNRRTMGKQDPYCAMRLAKEAKKTETDRRGGQTPKWDQELRFTVHDSPDYYKLKCSIFNDDKKTDLIGEAWIDLTDVVKLGGGQKDLWHQMNFKGKYAGDLRIELTFYDTREQPQDFRKSRQSRAQRMDGAAEASDSTLDLTPSAGRSLGPREIKRRALPESPVASNIPVQPPTARDIRATREPNAPQPVQSNVPQLASASEADMTIHAPVAKRVRRSSHQPDMVPMTEDLDSVPSYPIEDQSPYGRYIDDNATSTFDQVQPWQHQAPVLEQQYPGPHDQLQDYQQYLDHDHDQYHHEHQYEHAQQPQHQPYIEDEFQPSDAAAYHTPDMDHLDRPSALHMHSDPGNVYQQPAMDRPLPISTHSDGQLVRYTPGPPPHDIIAEEPVFHELVHRQPMTHNSPRQADVPPPLPPKHRDTPPRRQRSEFPPSSFGSVPQPLRIGANRASFSDRSPLQALEDDYLGPQELDIIPQALHLPDQRRSMNGFDLRAPAPENRSRNLERRSMQEIPTQVGQQRPTSSSRRSSYEIRNWRNPQPDIYAEPENLLPQADQSFEHGTSEPNHQPFVEDAPPSPGLLPTVTRKAIGASPKRLNGIPFGPDAYDVLNPSSSPVTNDRTIFQTPEQAKEASRIREAEQVKGLGPIIGNDGREIDPSDHLPSDTWAPEPERKQRKPEHVVHIRTKGDRPAGARTSPVVIRHNRPGQTNQSPQNSPFSTAASQPASSPAARPSPQGFIGGRNRLQKAMPPNATRNGPIYSSPAGGAISTPVVASPIHDNRHAEQTHPRSTPQQRRPSSDNRIPSHITRPPLAEYQIPVGSSYTPRSAGYDAMSSGRPQKAIGYGSYDDTPTKPSANRYSFQTAPNHDTGRLQHFDRRSSYDSRDRRRSYDQRSDHSFENHPEDVPAPTQRQSVRHFDDPLAAEMSLIDIGPSRSGYSQSSMSRSLVRRW